VRNINANTISSQGASLTEFTPASIPASFWYRMDDIVITSSPDIDQFNDKSSSNDGTQSTASKKAHLIASDINGEDVSGFDGADDSYDPGSDFEATFQSDFALSCVMEIQDGRPPVSSMMLGIRSASSANQVHCRWNSVGRLEFLYESDGNQTFFQSSSQMADGVQSYQIITWWADFTGGELKVRVDGVDLAHNGGFDGDTSTTTPANFTGGPNPFIGCQNNNGTEVFFASTNLADLTLYPVSGADDIDDIETYLSDRYSISLP